MDASGRAYGRGGPMDGAVLGEAGPEEYEIVMADGSRHRYVRSGDRTTVELGLVYEWAGRA